MPDIKLLTGIPRSGTTLCCKLLNSCSGILALHEPIDPQTISKIDTQQAVSEVTQRINDICDNIRHGKPITLGDKDNYLVDNPVGSTTKENGLRELASTRGSAVLPISEYNQLIIKQNALFTALADLLTEHFTLVAIIRNPVDVLLSWMTVDLPVNKGRLPAGEKFDLALRKSLGQEQDVLQRQLIIYGWFIERFSASGLVSVKYEDIIATNGQALHDSMDIEASCNTKLTMPKRAFAPRLIELLCNCAPQLEQLARKAGYSPSIITRQLEFLSQQNCS